MLPMKRTAADAGLSTEGAPLSEDTDDEKKVKSSLDIIRSLQRSTPGFNGDARYKVIFHRKDFSNFLKWQDDLIRPLTAEFWPSLSCNASCALCPYRQNTARDEADLSHELILATPAMAERVALELFSFGTKSVILTGGGEPFVNPKIDDIARTFKTHGLEFGLYTNGTVPNRGTQIDKIISLAPTFARISVNAGSAKEHHREYHIEPIEEAGKWVSAWEILKRNALLFVEAIKTYRVKTSFGFGFVFLGNERESTYEGIAKFLSEFSSASGHFPFYVHFRPKLIYYKRNGEPVASISDECAKRYCNIPRMVDEFVRPHVPGNISVQVNIHAVEYLHGEIKDSRCISTGWATSFNHVGEGFILSELCGSTWSDAKWGDLREQDINLAWFSPRRMGLQHAYADGTIQTPPYHKLASVNSFFNQLRAKAGSPFTDDEVVAFWQEVDAEHFPRPTHVDFI